MYTFFLFLTAEIQCYKTGIELFLYNPQETRPKKNYQSILFFISIFFIYFAPVKTKGCLARPAEIIP